MSVPRLVGWTGLCRGTLALLCVFGVAGVAAGEDLPAGAEVMAKYVDAVGGKAAHAKIESRVVKGTFSLPDMMMEGKRTTYIVPPDKSYTETEFDAFGSSMSGTKDGVAWAIRPNQGATVLEGPRRVRGLRQALLDPYLAWEKAYSKAETVGEAAVGEVACYKVVLTPSSGGNPTTCYFDKESGLLLRTETERRGVTSSTTYSEYKEVDGVKIAHKTSIEGGQYTFETTIDSVEHNVEIPDDRFEFPDEIKALLEK